MKRRKTAYIKFRIDQQAKSDIHRLANETGVTVSALLHANVKFILREQKVSFALSNDQIVISEIEKRARRQRAIDHSDGIDWSKIDVYDG